MTLLDELTTETDCATDLRDLDTETLLALRESQRKARKAYCTVYMNTSDRPAEPLREASERIREINLILEERGEI
jgi:hypothetical protein